MSTTSPDWGKTPWHISFHGKLSRLPGHVDIAIIGGGFTGLAAAAIAKRLAPKKSVLLLEAKRVGNGASGRTGGMVLGETAAGNLPGLGDVLKGYRKILRELGVSANLKLPGVWEIARSSHSMDGKRIKPLQNSPIDWNDSGRVRIVKKVPGGAVDPGKIIDGLARAAVRAGAVIAEGAEVTRIDTTNPIRIHVSLRRKRTKIVAATRVLLATNAGGLNLAGKIFTTAPEPKLTFALATAPLTTNQIAALGLASGRPFYTVDLPYLWGRLFETGSFPRKPKSKNRAIIFGSGLVPAFGESLPRRSAKQLWSGLEKENVVGSSSSQRLETLEQRVRALHPALKKIRITHRWGGPILLTKNFVPILRTHPKTKNLIFLGAYSGHGVALSVYLAKCAAQALFTNRKLPSWN